MRLGWRRGTRAFVIGVTMLTVVIAIAAGRTTGSRHPPNQTPQHAVPSPILPLGCHTATLAGSGYTVCEETTPVPK